MLVNVYFISSNDVFMVIVLVNHNNPELGKTSVNMFSSALFFQFSSALCLLFSRHLALAIFRLTQVSHLQSLCIHLHLVFNKPLS